MASAADLRSIYTALTRRSWPDARAECQRLLVVTPDSAALYHALGLSLCGEGQYALAVEPLDRAFRLDAGEIRHARDLAMVYGMLERWGDAVDTLSPIVQRLDSSAQQLFLRAAVANQTAASGLERFEAGVDVAGLEDADLLCEYGRALAAAGRTVEAEPVLQRCVGGPRPARAHDELAALYHLTRHGDLALHHSEAFARLQPASGYAWLRLALALSLRGRLDESRTCRRRAIELGLTRDADWSSALKLMLCDRFEETGSVLEVAARRFPAPRPSVQDRRARRRPPRVRL
jgi:Flp pilus assembly protein TadD